jgi:anaerobic selenocysteine-containing dehydrogenase
MDYNEIKISTSCTLDCWDSCSILATVSDNKIISLKGDNRNHITGNVLCAKGMRYMDMINHPDRIREPLIKEKNGWKRASWEEALDLVASKLHELRETYPTTALLHCNHAGNVGLLKKVENRFFSAYGGVTAAIGSLCVGAGSEGQRYDFGKSLSHEISDVVNSKTIIIWGRNPMDTGLHLVPFLKEAKRRGAYIIVIDPLETNTVKLADMHISPLPGTDGALALTMANILIERGLIDKEFIDKYVVGFDEFRSYIKDFTLEKGAKISSVPMEDIEVLVDKYGKSKPSSIIIGFGIQRYTNGGYTVRTIDALGAITGNIGIGGGGVNYNNSRMNDYVDHELLSGDTLRKHHRVFSRPKMAEFIETAEDPKVEIIFTTRANPLTQFMDSNRMARAFEKVGFKVTIDMFMTDTANLSDVVLPCRHFLEEDNIICPPSNHNYINYCNKVIEPNPWIPSELLIWNELAKRLKLENFPIENSEWWIEKALKPMTDLTGITIDDIKSGPIIVPGATPVAWDDKNFQTPSGKYELYSNLAKSQGFEPLPVYKSIDMEPNEEYPFYLLTPHTKDSLNSQHFVLVDEKQLPIVYIHSETGSKMDIRNGSVAEVFTDTGSLDCVVEYNDSIRRDILMIYQGWWIQRLGGVNRLISERYSDMGNNAAYYECICNIRYKV